MLLKLNSILPFFKSPNFRLLSISIKHNAKLFSNTHEWIEVNSNNIGTVGISEFAQDKLGDIVYVQLPEIGKIVHQNDECGVVESVKAASDICSPVSGEVMEVNGKLESDSGLVNKGPYTTGWLFKIVLSKSEELKSLMSEEDYNKFVENES